ncbi:hypothetical protein MTR_5g058215 [Medicago truncatula]|uniref:Uncharacterized protein n=1 Tax=Medicago truncatula TaxID=3880 RepID=A0A072UFW0_MEDTR|nr:hypothetical protein MTR_5g058215 [Medicago truncatula]
MALTSEKWRDRMNDISTNNVPISLIKVTPKPIRSGGTVTIKRKHRIFNLLPLWKTQQHVIVLTRHQRRNSIGNQVISNAIVINTEDGLKIMQNVGLDESRICYYHITILEKRN